MTATPDRSEAVPSSDLALAETTRGQELFRAHQERVYRKTDRVFAQLMTAQWLAGIVFALWVSPRAWAGSTSQVHVHVWAAVFLGGGITVFPVLLAIFRSGDSLTRYTIAVAQMLMGALLIHLTGGRIETHFHVFGSLAFLAFYRDWRVLAPATIVVAADHFLRGMFWPQSVYGVLLASQWRWVEHAAWVVFEDVILVMSCVRGTEELRQIAQHTAGLEFAHKEQARLALEQSELVSRLRLSQQQVEAATRAKSEFVANMSHELRTPLNAITLYGELLEEGARADGRETDVADLTKLQSASRHLLGLINGILDLSKIEAGKMELDLQTFDLKTMIDELVGAIDALVQKNRNTLRVTLGSQLGTMHADATKVRQILFNLLSNAAKFTSGGVVTLDVRRTLSDGVASIQFTVKDTGIGLTTEHKARLFQPFSQADSSTARKYGGTGLGLALVWRFCQLMGGDVKVDTPLEGGARFVVYLPVTVMDHPERGLRPFPGLPRTSDTVEMLIAD
jgi:two-component system, sensor histidine kinase and response regulator